MPSCMPKRASVSRYAAGPWSAPTSHAPDRSEAVFARMSWSYCSSLYASLSCASSWRISPIVISFVTRANTRNGSRSSRRTSSMAPCASSAATGRWRSGSATERTGWLTLLRLGERLGALAHVPEANVHGVHPAVKLARLDPLAQFLERAGQPVEDAQALLVTGGRQVERTPKDRLRHDVGTLVDEAHAQRLGAFQLPVGRPQRFLQLGNRLVQEAHLFEGHAQVVVRLEVALVDVFVDPLL